MAQVIGYANGTSLKQEARPMGSGKVSVYFSFPWKMSINFDWKRNHIHLLTQKGALILCSDVSPQPLWVNSKSMGIFEKTFVRK